MKTVGIFTAQVDGVDSWDPDNISKGITGSEEAVIYMSQQLAALGMRVIVFGVPPENSPHLSQVANPQFVRFSSWKKEPLDIAISWRMPHAAKILLQMAKKVYLWPHDTCGTFIPKDQIEAFDGVLWLSEWQRRQWISVNSAFKKFEPIFGNGIIPEQFGPIAKRENPFSCIYGSNYGRGLEELIDLWPSVKEKFPLATLDIYYGWQHWGLLKPHEEKLLKKKLERLEGAVDHGLVGHEELSCAYGKASFWTYPCKMPETFCITALRAQFAGAVPIVIQDSALNETVRHGYRCKQLRDYPELLFQALTRAESISLEDRAKMAEFILQEYTWSGLATRWKQLFEDKRL